MLLSHEHPYGDLPSNLDSIHNYYEGLVFEEIRNQVAENFSQTDYIADVACVALNNLPPRYIRHDVDMAFYLSPMDRKEMLDKVNLAVKNAINTVNNTERYSN
jgi:hypothetical protein